jgi:LysR family transcriptional regulator, glycine cleavage system transcriptional activator
MLPALFQNPMLDRYCAKNAQVVMARHLPPLNALRAFEAAGRHQSFSRAAEELNVSHSAISRHVRGLEHRLGAPLFRTHQRGVALTGAGERYLAYVSPAFDQIAEATQALAERPAGTLVVNSEPTFAIKWLTPRLDDFRTRFPKIDLRLDISQALVDVSRYEADLALRYIATGLPDGPADLIGCLPMYPFATPDLAATITVPRDLLNHALFRDRQANTWADWFALTGEVAPDELPPHGWRMRVMLALESALCGHGVILCSAELVERDVAAGRLVRCLDIPLSKGAYYLIGAQHSARSRAARAFRDWLLDSAEPLRVPANP